MMSMFGLISSCTGPFLQTYRKMALLTPNRGTNFLYGNKLTKASGPDLISPRLLKEGATILSKPLSIIFNR